MVQVVTQMCEGYPSADIREMLYIKENLITAHETDHRPPPSYYEENIYIDENYTDPPPNKILIFDDMITAGAHFKGCKNLLLSRFPGITVKGVFVARRKV